MRHLYATALITSALVLTGCTAAPVLTTTSTPTDQGQGAALNGRVHGGQQPVVGASVYLYAVGTGGYAGPGIAASPSNASVSLLNSSGSNTTKDANGNYYVTTDQNGNFSINGDYNNCANANTQVYIYSSGGNAGAGADSTIGLLAGLGSCGTLHSEGSSFPFIVVNEVSTVVTAYAIAGFATDGTHVSTSGSSLALQGVANAFATIPNMEMQYTGQALTTTPAGNGAVPQAEIYTLADVLAGCLNSVAFGIYSPGQSCVNLDSFVGLPVGADTAAAAIGMAHNPSALLFNLVPPNPPFEPTLPSKPNDFTIGILYSGPVFNELAVAVDGSGNVWVSEVANGTDYISVSELYAASYLGPGGSSSWSSNSPISGGGLAGGDAYAIAIDLLGNVWVAYSSGDGLVELNSSGAPQSPSTGYLDGSYLPGAVAVDVSGNIWTPSPSALYEYVPGTGFANGGAAFSGGGVYYPSAIVVDTSGNFWLSNVNGSLTEFSSTGVASGASPISGSSAGDAGIANSIGEGAAIDASGNIWVASGSAVAEFNSSGGAVSGSSGYTGGGYDDGTGIAIDGAGNVWTSNCEEGDISEFSSAGKALSPSTGYVNSLACPYHIAIDGSGNVWVANFDGPNLVELVGAAAPVVTPIVANLKSPYGAHAVNLP